MEIVKKTDYAIKYAKTTDLQALLRTNAGRGRAAAAISGQMRGNRPHFGRRQMRFATEDAVKSKKLRPARWNQALHMRRDNSAARAPISAFWRRG
jgi:hypothetical protein